MGSFLNSINAKVKEELGMQPLEFGEKPFDELSAKGKREYQEKSFDETREFLISKGYLNEGTEHLEEYLSAVREGRPIICIQAGTTGLPAKFSITTYDEKGNANGKRNPFLGHMVTNVGLVVSQPNEKGIYKNVESYQAVMEKISPEAIEEAGRRIFEHQCSQYNSDHRARPLSEYKGYDAIKEGGFGVPVTEGGFGFNIEDRFGKEICKKSETVQEDLNNYFEKYKDALWITNLEGLDTTWLPKSDVNMKAHPITFQSIMKEFQLNSNINPFLDENGKVIKSTGLDTLRKQLQMPDVPLYKAVDRATAFGEILEKVIDQVNDIAEIRQTEVLEELKRKMEEIDNMKVIPKTEENTIKDNSSLESLGALGDMGMQIGKANKERYTDLYIGMNSDLSLDSEKHTEILDLMLKASRSIAASYNKKHSLDIKLASFTANPGKTLGELSYDIAFMNVPKEQEEDFKAFVSKVRIGEAIKREFAKENEGISIENAEFIQEVRNETSDISLTELTDESISKMKEYYKDRLDDIKSEEMAVKEPTLEEEKPQKEPLLEDVDNLPTEERISQNEANMEDLGVIEELRNRLITPSTHEVLANDTQKEEIKTISEEENKKAEAEKWLKKTEMNTAVSLAITTLVSAIQEPILKKLEEQDKEIANLKDALESAKRLIEENGMQIASVISKQIEMEASGKGNFKKQEQNKSAVNK